MVLARKNAIRVVLSAQIVIAPVQHLYAAQPSTLNQAEDGDQFLLYRDIDLNTLTSDAVEKRYREQVQPLSYEQTLDYAMSKMILGKYQEASILYEMAWRAAPNTGEQVFSLMWYGQALLDLAAVSEDEATNHIRMAGEIFNKASRLAPESSEATAMRLVAWRECGDGLETMAAEHDLRRLGIDLEGDEVVLATGTILAITFSGVVATYVIYLLQSKLSEDEKLDRLEGLMRVCVGAMWSSKPKAIKTINPDW